MASSLEELLAQEGFKGSRRVTRSRSSFHYGTLTEPLYSSEEHQRRLSLSSERVKTQGAKSDASRHQSSSGPLKGDFAESRRPRDDLLKREKMDEPLSNKTEQKSCSNKESGKGLNKKSPEHMPRYEITGVSEQEDNGVKYIYSNEVSNAKRGKEKNSNELVVGKEKWREKAEKDANLDKRHGRNSNVHKLGNLSGNGKSIKPQESTYNRSNSKTFEDSSSNKNQEHAMQAAASSLAIDEVAVQAVVSILSGYIKRFLKDEDFRSTLRHHCFSSLNFIELEDENNTEFKVIRSLEEAIEITEQTAEESTSTKYLKRAMMQLSIITGLSLNDLKYETTCGIPNYKLSACAHLYLSVVYKIQKKDKVSAKHLLQVFCDSPLQARIVLLPEPWEHLFAPQLSHLKAWYNKEAETLVDTPSKTRKLKLLQKVYDEHLDTGTHIYAEYYRDWLTEGVESPSVPSISVPLVSVAGSQQGSSRGYSSESGSSIDPFSPQPMVSKQLYDSVFASLSKPGVYEDDEDNLDNSVRGSYGSAIVKQILTYESETVKFVDQDMEDFTKSMALVAFHPQKGTLMTAVEERKERNLSDDVNNSLNSVILDTLPHEKAKEVTLRKQPNKISSSLEGSYFSSIPEEFICPLTGTLFEEPVTLETGQTYEREAIKAWFEKGNKTCPVTENTLECVAIPFTNLVLKRLIDNWKSEQNSHLLDVASQIMENSKEHNLKNTDEAVVFKLERLLTSLSEEDRPTYAKHLISLGIVSFLLRRFELGNVEEKSHVLVLLLNCIAADSSCIYQMVRCVNKKCLLELLHSKEVTRMTNAILLLTELLSLERGKDVTSFISGMAGEDVFDTMHILLMYLKNSPPHETPLIAVLLLHFDRLVEPQNCSIYREVAVNAIALALEASLNDEKAREKCCRALSILGGHFSSAGKILTKTSILKQSGYDTDNDSSDVKPPGCEEEGLLRDLTISSVEDEPESCKLWLMNLVELLIGDGESLFLKTISRCLDSRHLDLVGACLLTVTWLSSSLSMLHNAGAGLHLPAVLAVSSQLKGILENGEFEHKALASMSLLNLSEISECRTLLKTMAAEIAPLLHRLADVTWTAKQLHAVVSGESH